MRPCFNLFYFLIDLQILAIVLTTVSAVPIPKSFGTDGRIGKQFYYPVPASYSQINSQYSNQVAPEYVINQRPVSYPNLVPNKDLGADGNIQLVLSVPSAVPPGTSLSVTVNVNSEPNGATVVSVSNPVVSAPAQAPAAPDSITVDAPSSGKKRRQKHKICR